MSLLRKSYRTFAESIIKKDYKHNEIDNEEMNEAIRKVRARGSVRKEGMSLDDLRDFKEPVAAGSRKCKKKYKTLNALDKMKIVHQVVVLKEI